ncbi:MAG: FkbM family methyltransferase [Syntrophaceae bacterium]|nr:FkbM family methyltransferase [Syntrophaceae bacterium]
MGKTVRNFLVRVGYNLISKGLKLPEGVSEVTSNALKAIFLKDLLNRLKVNCVLDIGAHHGSYVMNLRRIGFKGYIYSFEPDPRSFDILSSNHYKDPLWKGFRIAVGSENTTLPFNMTDLSCLSSFLTPKSAEITGAKMVNVKRLDHVIEDLLYPIENPRVFVKIDTQGYDLEVIKGASGCMEMIKGFQSEISVVPVYENMPHYLEALQFYESLGFALMNLFAVTRSPGYGNVVEYDCLMVKLQALSNG